MIFYNSKENPLVVHLTLKQFLKKIKECVSDVVQSIIPQLKKAVAGSTSPKLYNRQETAKVLNVSITTLHNWTNQGRLVPIKIGRKRLYSIEQIEALTIKE